MPNMERNKYLFSLLLLFGVVTLFACSSPEPIQIRITPTPQATATYTASPVPTLLIPSQTPSLTPDSTTATENPYYRGPITGENYTLPTLEQEFADIPTITPTPLPPTPQSPTATPGPTSTPVPLMDANNMGIQVYSNVDFDRWMRVIGLAQVTGVKWVKIQVNWGFIQPEGPNTFGEQFQLFERQIEAVKRAGFNVILSIAKAPNWARSVQIESGPPDDPQVYADFLTFMLTNTKIGQSIDAIEVWNEPNLRREWQGTLDFSGAGYMRLFAPAYQAIRAYSPSMTIITAGLAPTSNLDGAVDDRLFLQQMYDAGLGNYTDIAIGAHPYGWGNPPDVRCCDAIAGRGWDDNEHFFFIHNLEDTYAIMSQNGHNNLQIWVTEFGWATWEGLPSEPPEEWMLYNTAADQANYALRAFQIGDELPYVGPMILWNLNFANAFTVENRDEVAAYSIINPVIFPQERPLYWALAWATGSVEEPRD